MSDGNAAARSSACRDGGASRSSADSRASCAAHAAGTGRDGGRSGKARANKMVGVGVADAGGVSFMSISGDKDYARAAATA